ncbi:MAG: fumarylacetoacetate hydrolase family protein, partial [Candidatus Caldarchaeum sp.]
RPKIICVGLNYRDHAEEQGVKPPDEPVIFMKPYTAITGPGNPIIYPKITRQLDYEAELAVVIGRKCRNVSRSQAHEFILGYTCFNDVSARDIQFKDGQWVRGKSFDTFAPIGPWVVTQDEVGDPHSLKIMSRVNGEIRQSSNTRNMVFGVYQLVEFISSVMTLDPGDVIATGTPSGVGVFYKPAPKLLNVGDLVEVEIEKIGVLANVVGGEP